MSALKKIGFGVVAALALFSCGNDDYQTVVYDNPEIDLEIPDGFPPMNPAVSNNRPTVYGVELGEKLFHDARLSADNSISCASCHKRENAFADGNVRAIGIYGRIGLRNVPPLQNLAFLNFYNWDGNKLRLENQPIVPIITHEEMDSSILEVIGKIQSDSEYKDLFTKAFGSAEITPERIYKSIAQYEYTLILADSRYDKMKKGEVVFSETERIGYEIFQQKCASCHSGELFTDQSFRNIGFPQNTDTNEAGRARVTGEMSDFMRFRVPSLRNVALTAPYGSFGQFGTLREVLDYFDKGVLSAENLDPLFLENGGRILLSEEEKRCLEVFLRTLTDEGFAGK